MGLASTCKHGIAYQAMHQTTYRLKRTPRLIWLQVYFPERPGALRAFLSEIVPTWNLTLFHYRKSGNTSTSILVGIQVPPETEKAFKAAQNALGDEFDFTELDDKARQMFDMFIS